MKILVTGNKGYIGAVLCKKLIEEKFYVIGLDTNFYDGCDFSKTDYSVSQINKDVRNISTSDLLGIDSIIHLAALSNDPMGELNPHLTHEINCQASIKLAKLAKENGVKRFIFSSSCSIYGKAGEEAIDEKNIPMPVTEYAKSKAGAETEISLLADESFSPVFLRNATVYGFSPKMRVDLVVNNLVCWAYTTGKIKIMSDGTPWRPLIHIQDICNAFIAVLKAPRQLVYNQVFNVGKNSENYRIKDIANAINKILPDCKIEYTGEHGVDTRTYKVDFTKIEKTLERYFRPSWDIEKGIKEIYDSFMTKNHNEFDFFGNKFIRLERIKKLLKEGKVDENLYWKEKSHD